MAYDHITISTTYGSRRSQQGEEGAPKHKAGGWEVIPKWDGGDGNGGVAKVAFFVGKGGLKPKDPFGRHAVVMLW